MSAATVEVTVRVRKNGAGWVSSVEAWLPGRPPFVQETRGVTAREALTRAREEAIRTVLRFPEWIREALLALVCSLLDHELSFRPAVV